MNYANLANRVLAGDCPTRTECLEVLQASDEHFLDLVSAAFRLRHHFFWKKPSGFRCC